MTLIEKKKRLKKIIDSLSSENLDQAFYYISQLSTKDKNRILIVKNLLKEEKWLFEELAK